MSDKPAKYIITIKQNEGKWSFLASATNGEDITRTPREFTQLKHAFEYAVKKLGQWEESAERQVSTGTLKQVAGASKS